GKYAVEKYSTFKEDMAIDGELAEIAFQQNGYLFLVHEEEEMKQLEKQEKLQQTYDVGSQVFQKDELKQIIPEMNLNDLAGGIYSSKDGHLDPYSAMQGYIKKAKQLGATYMYEKVEQIVKVQNNVNGVMTEG